MYPVDKQTESGPAVLFYYFFTSRDSFYNLTFLMFSILIYFIQYQSSPAKPFWLYKFLSHFIAHLWFT